MSGTVGKSERPTSTLRVHALRVEVTAGPDRGRSLRVESPTLLVGSGPTTDLRLVDDTVSREHLRLTLHPDGVHVRDLGSTNGTWAGATRLHEIRIAQSTSIAVGDTTLLLAVEGEWLELPLSERAAFGHALGDAPGMRHVFAVLERAAKTEATVLLEGESGVGKDVLANAVHAGSARASGPFVALDCGAIPPTLIDSELFGHERGAFTGADRTRAGAFEQASGGTLFLDEIGELPLDVQPRLLRVLEAREVRPVGGRGAKRVDVRIIAATNKNLAEAARRGEFRSDLFYRLAVVRVRVPPLRERHEDVPLLARAFLRELGGESDLPPDLAEMLVAYAWPGNVRELKNVMSRYAVLGPNPALLFDRSAVRPRGDDLSHLPYHLARAAALERFEREYLPRVLERAGGVVVRAAELAEVGRGSFHRMLHRMRAGKTDDDEG
jgi:DNA-binding NtrC family response regulator